MANIVSITQRIDQLDSGSFQLLCNAYLSREGYPNLVALGSKSGSTKTTKGTPDTYFALHNGKYIFAEYTTQKTNLSDKIRSDLGKCFDVAYTGVDVDDIIEIVYCHTSSNISPALDKELKQSCIEKNIKLTLLGIDYLAEELYRKYPVIVKDYLGLTIDTEQILGIDDFIKQYDANDLAAPLSTVFRFREKELEKLDIAFGYYDVVILSGNAGVGKTRLALKYAKEYAEKHGATLYIIRNHGLPLFEDLKLYFETPGQYFIVVDDADHISEMEHVIEYVNKKYDGYHVKIIVTVRNYAIQKVKADFSGLVRYGEVTIGILSDKEVEHLLEGQYGIINQDYLDRIVSISEGNARIAIIAGKIAAETNRLKSISDASQLYEEYYGQAFRNANLEHDQQLQIAAGVVAFLGSIHLDNIEPIISSLFGNHFNTAQFLDCIYKLNELELVDIFHDKAVIVSDQCFSNFILKYVFFDCKSIRLSHMLDACFDSYQQRTIQAVNTLLGIFQNRQVHDYVTSEINAVWNKRRDENSAHYWDWIKAFYLVRQEEALLLLKDRIDSTEPVLLSADDIDVNNGKTFVSVRDEIISMLCGYVNTVNLEAALDLLFEYYLKRPDLFMQFFHGLDTHFGINRDAINYGFPAQIQLIKSFVKHANDWKNEHICILFFEVAKNYLQVHFSPSESSRRNTGITIYNFSIIQSEATNHYRKLIWEQLLAIQKEKNYKEAFATLFKNYARGVDESSYGIIKEDAPFICQLLCRCFSTDSIIDCIIVEHIDHVFRLAEYKTNFLDGFLYNDAVEIYHLLTGPSWDIENDYHKNELKAEHGIVTFIAQSENHFSSFDRLFQIYIECINNDITDNKYKLSRGMMYATRFMLNEKADCLYASFRIISLTDHVGFNIFEIISRLFSFLSNSELINIIKSAPNATLDSWLFAYYHEIPEDRLSEYEVEEFYRYLECKFDQQLHSAGYRSLDFLSKYESFDPCIFIKSIKLIFAKHTYSPFIVSIYVLLMFNDNLYTPETIIEKFEGELELLEDIYLFEIKNNTIADVDGIFFRELCRRDTSFCRRYVKSIYDADHYYQHNQSERVQSLFSLSNYLSLLDLLIDDCITNESTFFLSVSSLMEDIILVSPEQIDASDRWITHYISEYCNDSNKMCCLFGIIAKLPDNRKLQYIELLVNKNDSPEFFELIPLCPTSYSWAGSVVPLYSEWIHYLEQLRSLFPGIRFLRHKIIVEKEIERYKRLIQKEEIDSILQG